MLRWIVGSSLKLRFVVVTIAVAIVFFGVDRFRKMPVDILPEFAPPLVEIQTEALGLSAAEVEALITNPLEEFLAGMPWLEVMRSKSVTGLSSIVLIFKPGTDFKSARQFVQERLNNAGVLPNVSKPPTVIQPLSSTSRFMKIGLSSDELSLIEMSVLARWKIRPRLMGVPGVANVAIWGQRKRQLQVQVDPDRLRAHGVSLQQIIKATGNSLWWSPLSFLNASTPGTGGWIDVPNHRLEVRHVLPISSPDDLAEVTFKTDDGATLRLGDVVEVVEGHPPLIGDAIVGDSPSLLLVVQKFPWANALEATRGVEEELEIMRPGLPGLELDSTIFRSATFIEMAIDNLAMVLTISGVLVILALGAFLYNWRVALISIVAIPLSLLSAGLVLYLSGATINAMVFAGLVVALGAVVDDAIIWVENIVRRLHQHRQEGSDKSTATIILEASLEMRSAIVYATLIILLAVVPVFVMGGLVAALLKPLALSYALALLASMVVALTVTPALSLMLLSKSSLEGRRESPLVRWLYPGYSVVLSRIVHTPAPAFVTFGVVVLTGIAVVPLLGQSLVPSFKERDLLIEWQGKPGISPPEMNRITIQAIRELQEIPGIRNLGAHVGRALTGDEIVNINSGELWVSLDPETDYDATLAAIQKTVDGYPGMHRDVLTYPEQRIREVLAEPSKPIVVRILGPELKILRSKAEEVRQILSKIDGIVDLQVELQAEKPQVEIEVDLVAAQRHGITPGDVRRGAATLLAGIEVGNLFEEQKVFEVVVWGAPETRHSVTSVRELLIETPSGDHVRLADVADVRIAPTPNLIEREGASRYIDVSANVSSRHLDAVVRDVERRLQEVEFPLEYHPELLEDFAETQDEQNRVLAFAVAAAIGAFLLLQASFGSWRLASVTFIAFLSVLTGGVLTAYLGGGIISLGSLVGFLTVLGIAARNGILLISHYQHLEQHEGETFGPELVLRGTRERAAPILMTATATALALVPLVVFGDIAGLEIAHPMAVVILGGLVTSTLLNLFVVPTLYLRFGSVREDMRSLEIG